MKTYKVLKNQVFTIGKYSLVPIRYEDRIDIMKWRNEQIYHLRQNKLLTEEDQNIYFNNIVNFLFDLEKPNQILFSFLYENKFIGYGGLVHINWEDQNAEISFVMDTKLEVNSFAEIWKAYLKNIEVVAFIELSLHKIYTYAFDLRPHLYEMLDEVGYKKEAVLKQHCFYNKKFIDVIIHSKLIQDYFHFYLASEEDIEIYYLWVNESKVRDNSFNQDKIEFEDHKRWYLKKIKDQNSKMYILKVEDDFIGQVRIDLIDSFWFIDYSIDKNHRKNGYGKKILELLFNKVNKKEILKAKVKLSNHASIKVFEYFDFVKTEINDDYIEFTKIML
jgi:RimJ/RimL family protein N-acetyltransferase